MDVLAVPLMIIVTLGLLLGFLIVGYGGGDGVTPHQGDRRTQVYQCHTHTSLIPAGKGVMVPTSRTSCDWVTKATATSIP